LIFAVQQNSNLDNETQSAGMFSGLFSIRYMATKHFDVYGRVEVYHDPDGFYPEYLPMMRII